MWPSVKKFCLLFYFCFELGVTVPRWRLISSSALLSDFCLSQFSLICPVAGVVFTKDGRYMAVAERRDCKDFISIFVCSNWQLLRVSSASPPTLLWGLHAHIAHYSISNSERSKCLVLWMCDINCSHMGSVHGGWHWPGAGSEQLNLTKNLSVCCVTSNLEILSLTRRWEENLGNTTTCLLCSWALS